MIDGAIGLSNVLIRAVNVAGGGSASVWATLTNVVKQSGAQGVASLLIMIVFLIFAVILLIYYVGRLVALYIGAVLSPLILLIWLIPGFRDFSESAAKVYLATVFVLFVNAVILILAASLFSGMEIGSPTHVPNTLMALVVGLATLIALLKTQGVMMQFSYASIGPRSARKLGGHFMTGVSYISGRGKTVSSNANNSINKKQDSFINNSSNNSSNNTTKKYSSSSTGVAYKQPHATNASTLSISKNNNQIKTGTTLVAPKRTNELKANSMEEKS